jgi:hypothetical protein
MVILLAMIGIGAFVLAWLDLWFLQNDTQKEKVR